MIIFFEVKTVIHIVLLLIRVSVNITNFLFQNRLNGTMVKENWSKTLQSNFHIVAFFKISIYFHTFVIHALFSVN